MSGNVRELVKELLPMALHKQNCGFVTVHLHQYNDTTVTASDLKWLIVKFFLLWVLGPTTEAKIIRIIMCNAYYIYGKKHNFILIYSNSVNNYWGSLTIRIYKYCFLETFSWSNLLYYFINNLSCSSFQQ